MPTIAWQNRCCPRYLASHHPRRRERCADRDPVGRSTGYEGLGRLARLHWSVNSAGVKHAEGGVRAVGVVLGPPVGDEDLGFEERVELLDGEQFARSRLP
jgi:hypothetical protein